MNRRVLIFVVGILTIVQGIAFAEELSPDRPNAAAADLTRSIDGYFARYWKDSNITVSPICSDEELVRRAYLDLAGRIPTLGELESFLTDQNESKRERLFDQLLSSSEFGDHFANVFNVVLLGPAKRNNASGRQSSGWNDYLVESFNTNRRWNQIARDMTLARETPETDIRAGWFLYERRNDHQAIAESIAPNFFGIRIECAQCHDHPLADEIRQAHYWGLVAFFQRGKNTRTNAGPRVVESAIGGFNKFSDLAGDSFDTELTFFDSPTVDEPRPEGEQSDADEYYVAAQNPQEPRVPKFSRREKFANVVLQNDRLLSRAFVNKMWALLIGRGFVHPVDQMDSEHPADHEELLENISKAFIESDFDMKQLVSNIVNSRCYQLQSIPATETLVPESFGYGLEKPLIADSYLRSMAIAVHNRNADSDGELLKEFRRRFSQVFPEVITSDLMDALYLTNNAQFHEYLSSVKNGTVDKLLAEPASTRIETLFKIVFGRSPDIAERSACEEFLHGKSEPAGALNQLLWAMMTSAEFRYNH